MSKAKIHIGTSGWSYKHWKGTFYPADIKEKDQFNYYQKYFDTVELNSSFYHLPSQTTFQNWANAVPENFTFSVKASRFITHMKKLKDVNESIEFFIQNVNGLKEKLGPILFQLPPGWNINEERLSLFLKQLPKGYRYTFEFRNQTWYDQKIYNLLRQYNCAFCMYELERHLSPEVITADFIYIRLHGPGNKYQGSYPEEILKEWADKCNSWLESGKDVYVYFDNDQLGYAAFNANELLKLVKQKI